MKVFLKKDKTQLGRVLRVYISESGQKRMEVRFNYSVVDAAVTLFEVL